MSELELLKKENQILKKKLEIAQKWMQRAVKAQVKEVSLHHFGQDFELNLDNLEEEVSLRIINYFGELALINVPGDFIENVIKAEINYELFRVNPDADGIGVVVSYHKAIDVLIESLITKGFRKYANKNPIKLTQNDSLDKFLYSVVNKGYILSIGRLYHILDNIKSGKKLPEFQELFKNYLTEYDYINDVLLRKNFLSLYKDLIDLEIFGKKRHEGNINFVETRKVRDLLIGGLEDKNSFIFKLVEISYI